MWKSNADYSGPGAVAWEKLCTPKKAGGLGLRNLYCWNKAAMLKHIWAISKKKESLWIQWVHYVYLKGEEVWEHRPPSTSYWQWKSLMAIKEEVKGKFTNQMMQKYTISVGYNMLMGEFQKERWALQVWNKWSLPKHTFISWLAVQDRMNTRERVGRYINLADRSCVLCTDSIETRDHLLFDCIWSKICLGKLKSWLNWRCSATKLMTLLKWIQRSRITKTRKQMYIASLTALIHMIWYARNTKIWEGTSTLR